MGPIATAVSGLACHNPLMRDNTKPCESFDFYADEPCDEPATCRVQWVPPAHRADGSQRVAVIALCTDCAAKLVTLEPSWTRLVPYSGAPPCSGATALAKPAPCLAITAPRLIEWQPPYFRASGRAVRIRCCDACTAELLTSQAEWTRELGG